MAVAQIPTSERGSVTHGQLTGLPNWIIQNSGTDTYDHVPEWTWPRSIELADRMCRSTGLRHHIRSVEMPILGFKWWLDPQDCDEQTAANIARDLGIGVGEEGKPEAQRTAGRFSLRDHLRLALDAPLRYGHAVFEQVAEVQQGGSRDGWIRLKKLAPRPQNTLAGFIVAEDGGLVAVQQNNPADGQVVDIPVDRVVVYVWDQRPGIWVGEPLIRSCYESWFLRDLLIRLDATKHDRNSMGVPVATPREGATPSGPQQADALEQMTAVRAGDQAGLVASDVYEFAMQGISGATSDPIESVKYHDQQISKQFLGMVMDTVSSETGNRSVAGVVDDKFANGVESIAQNLADTFTAHVLEDQVDWQGDPTAPAPRLRFTATDPEVTASVLFDAINAGAIQVDDQLEEYVRDKFRLPQRTSPRTQPPPGGTPGFGGATVETTGGTQGQGPSAGAVQAAAAGTPDGFHRHPTPVEVQAAVDFPALAARWRRDAARLAEQVAGERATAGLKLAGQLADLIAAGKVEEARKLAAPLVGESQMAAAFVKAVENGAADHAAEAKAQGAPKSTPDLAPARKAASELASNTAALIGSELKAAALSKAIAANGPAASAASVAAAVAQHVQTLSDANVVSRVGAGVVSSTGEGRVAVMQDLADRTTQQFYASELIDSSTCTNCESIDGTEYASLDDALADYPSGAQYVNCEGGPNCRGLLVAVYDESAPSSQEPGA